MTGTAGTVVPAGFLVSTNGGLQYTVMSAVTIGESGSVLALVRAVETGPEYNTAAGTVQVIVNPSSVVGVESVTNDAEIAGGRLKETDAEYRERYYKSVDYRRRQCRCLAAALLNEVEGVSSAFVYENDSDDFDDTYNLPAHAIEAVVYGGIVESIAKTIYERKSGGIQTIGNTAVNVVTASQQQKTIRFSADNEKSMD